MKEKRFCCLFILRVILLEFLKKLIRTYQGFLVAFKSTYQTDFQNRLWRLHHTKVLASLSNGLRFPSSLKDLGLLFPDLVSGFVTLLAWFVSAQHRKENRAIHQAS